MAGYRLKTVLVLIALHIFPTGCLRTAADAPETGIPLTVLFQGTQCGAASPDFRATWFSRPEQMGTFPGNTIDPVKISATAWDPNTEGALLLHMGTRRTGGYGLELTSPAATLHHGTATVLIRMKAPAANMFTTQAITSPCLLLKIPKQGIRQFEVLDQDGSRLTRIEMPADR